MYHQINLIVSEDVFYDLKRPFDLVQEFIQKLGRKKLEGYCFNRYGTNRIALRLNFKNDDDRENAIIVAEEMKESGKILAFFGKQDVPNELELWKERQFVKAAFEIGMICAEVFVAQLKRGDRPRSMYGVFWQRNLRLKPLIIFMYKFLVRCRVKATIIQKLRNDILNDLKQYGINERDVDRVADLCARRFRRELELRKSELPENKADFLERFIHGFLNCAGYNPQEERDLIIELARGMFYNELAKSWKP